MSFPSKYKNLKTLFDNRIKIPQSLFLGEETMIENTYQLLIKNELSTHSGPFIIRSCIEGEDSPKNSQAGQFISKSNINAKELEQEALNLFWQNKEIQKELLPNGSTSLIIQPYIKCRMGGVLFSPWKYFANNALIEASPNGAEGAVEGKNSLHFIIGPTPPDSFGFQNPEIEKKLLDILHKIKELFDYPIDIEWGIDEDDDIVIFQLRPITRNIKALKSASQEQIESLNLQDQDLHLTAWGESFGELSLLSWDVIQTSLKKSTTPLQKLGFKAEEFNFLTRLPNGRIYTDKIKEKKFYQTSFFSGFSKGLHKSSYHKKLQKFSFDYNLEAPFDINTLTQIGSYWMVANIFATTKTKLLYQEGEYELGLFTEVKPPQEVPKASWDELKTLYKELYLYELNKLRTLVSQNNYSVFNTFENLTQTPNQDQIQEELGWSVYSFPSNFRSPQGTQVVISGQEAVEGKVFFIENPDLFQDAIPEDVILVAPFFDNRWVSSLPKLKAVILSNGGMLSHSAILAREQDLPYFIHAASFVSTLKTGDIVSIDPKQNTLSIKEVKSE